MPIRQSLTTTTQEKLEQHWLNDLTSSKRQNTTPRMPRLKCTCLLTNSLLLTQLVWGRVSRSGLASPHSTEKPEALSHLFNAKGWSSQSMGHVMPTSHQHHCKQKNWGQPNMPSLHPAEVVECLSMPVYHTQREFWQPHLPNISKHKIPQANSAVCPLSSEGGGCRKGP